MTVIWNTPKPSQPWSCPAGSLVTSTSVDRATWLEARRDMICGSDIAAILGVGKFNGAYTVWADKVGRLPDRAPNDAMMRGQIFEDAVVDLWTSRYVDFPIETRRQGLMRSRAFSHAGATVDRLSICELGRCIVEVKTQNDLDEWDDDEVPLIYQPQGQWQMGITGRTHVHWVVLGPRFVPIHRLMMFDPELFDHMLATARSFWNDHVVTFEPPAADHRDSDTLKMLYGDPATGTKYELISDEARELADALPELKSDADAAKRSYEDTLAQLQGIVGNATEIVRADGTLFATWRAQKRVDGVNADFKRAHPDEVAEAEVPSYEVDVSKLVENHPEFMASGELRYRRSWLLKK